jgi:4-amino-4-deoxy-L-arabinose transferase-like glycosyltransferase
MKKNRSYLILFLITLAAAFLRFYKLGSFSLSNDELSALNRLQFSNFHDLITQGVVPDFHPALVQVFLYYWTKLFGLSPFVVRLPFILLGIASVPLAFMLAKRWFNQEA